MAEFSFENSLKELEKILSALESGDASLEESMELFEKGIKLSKECSEYLKNAKQKIITLTQAESEEDIDD